MSGTCNLKKDEDQLCVKLYIFGLQTSDQMKHFASYFVRIQYSHPQIISLAHQDQQIITEHAFLQFKKSTLNAKYSISIRIPSSKRQSLQNWQYFIQESSNLEHGITNRTLKKCGYCLKVENFM